MPLPEPVTDPELERLLAAVNELAASVGVERARAAPDAFLERVGELQRQFAALRPTREEVELQCRLLDYAEHRFTLVDEARDYARAAEELLTASLVFSDSPELIAPALQRGVVRLSAVLSEPGVPQSFGRLLRRLRELARQSSNADLRAWVDGVVASLPD
jgi:sugar-specific transcriptional regulator TrmB